jgi:hypothetical protein
MSFTMLASTSSPTKVKRQDSYTGSIILSPTKKRKVQDSTQSVAQPSAKPSHYQERSYTRAQPIEHSTRPTHEDPHKPNSNSNAPTSRQSDILRWTLSQDAIATCWIRDMMEMKPSDNGR